MENKEPSKTVKTLQECKELTAKKNGFTGWSDLQDKMKERYSVTLLVHEVHLEQVAILYAQSQTEEKDDEIKQLKDHMVNLLGAYYDEVVELKSENEA